MRMHTRCRRRLSKCCLLSLELLEGRQLLSWSALPQVAVAPPFIGPVQTAPTGSAQTPIAKTPAVTSNTTAEADSTPDDDHNYANSPAVSTDTTPSNFVGPVQIVTPATGTSSSGATTDAYTSKDYAKTSSDYSYSTYDKSYGAYYQTYQTPRSESAGALDAKPSTPVAETTQSARPTAPLAAATAPLTVLASKANEAASASTNHVPVNATRASAEATPTGLLTAPFTHTHHLSAAPASSIVTDQVGLSPVFAAAPVLPGAPIARLLAGAVAIDLASLKGAVDRFFASLDELAQGIGAAPDLARWLLTGAMATGVFEFVRTKSQAAIKPPLGERDDDLWAPYPVLVLVPAEDMS